MVLNFRTKSHGALDGSRFWFWVPFRRNGIKIGINLNYDWIIWFHFLFHPVREFKGLGINNQIWQTSTFGSKMHFFWIMYHFFTTFHQRPFETSNNATWIQGSRTGEGNDVLSGGYRVFLTGDRQTNCLRGDRQRTVWCLEEDDLRNRRTECGLTVSGRRPDKLGCRSNSLSFCVTHPTSHVSS